MRSLASQAAVVPIDFPELHHAHGRSNSKSCRPAHINCGSSPPHLLLTYLHWDGNLWAAALKSIYSFQWPGVEDLVTPDSSGGYLQDRHEEHLKNNLDPLGRATIVWESEKASLGVLLATARRPGIFFGAGIIACVCWLQPLELCYYGLLCSQTVYTAVQRQQ